MALHKRRKGETIAQERKRVKPRTAHAIGPVRRKPPVRGRPSTGKRKSGLTKSLEGSKLGKEVAKNRRRARPRSSPIRRRG